MIHPWITGMEPYFADDFWVYQHGDLDGLRAAIDFLLKSPNTRELLRQHGHQRVTNYHTYTHRLQAMLALVVPGEGAR